MTLAGRGKITACSYFSDSPRALARGVYGNDAAASAEKQAEFAAFRRNPAAHGLLLFFRGLRSLRKRVYFPREISFIPRDISFIPWKISFFHEKFHFSLENFLFPAGNFLRAMAFSAWAMAFSA